MYCGPQNLWVTDRLWCHRWYRLNAYANYIASVYNNYVISHFHYSLARLNLLDLAKRCKSRSSRILFGHLLQQCFNFMKSFNKYGVSPLSTLTSRCHTQSTHICTSTFALHSALPSKGYSKAKRCLSLWRQKP